MDQPLFPENHYSSKISTSSVFLPLGMLVFERDLVLKSSSVLPLGKLLSRSSCPVVGLNVRMNAQGRNGPARLERCTCALCQVYLQHLPFHLLLPSSELLTTALGFLTPNLKLWMGNRILAGQSRILVSNLKSHISCWGGVLWA